MLSFLSFENRLQFGNRNQILGSTGSSFCDCEFVQRDHLKLKTQKFKS